MSLGQLGPYLLCLTPIPLIHCDIFNIAIGVYKFGKYEKENDTIEATIQWHFTHTIFSHPQ